MKLSRVIRVVAFVAGAAVSFGAPSATARGDLGVDHDVCVLEVGPDRMYFAGYQPGVSPRKFCEDVPSVGQTIFVFDFAEPELREMSADFRILRQSTERDGAIDTEAATLAYLPANVYPKGTFSFQYEFTRPGEYIGVVTVDGERGVRWVARFPFSVAPSRFERTPYYLLAAAIGLALILFFSRDRRPTRRANGGGRQG